MRAAKEGAAGRKNTEAPEGDGDVGDDRSRRLRRKLRRSVVGGSQGAEQGPYGPRRTCAQRQLSEKSDDNARRCPTAAGPAAPRVPDHPKLIARCGGGLWCGQTKNYGLSLSSEPRSAKESTGKRIGWGTSRGCSCKKSNRERSRYPFPAEFGLAASPMLSTSPWRGQERRRDGKLRAWRTGLNELKG